MYVLKSANYRHTSIIMSSYWERLKAGHIDTRAHNRNTLIIHYKILRCHTTIQRHVVNKSKQKINISKVKYI